MKSLSHAASTRHAPSRARRVLIAGSVIPIAALGGMGVADDPPVDSLPAVPFPVENPFSESKRILGKMLFWDEQLSADNTMACASCHAPEFGGGDSRRALHPGVDGVQGSPDDVFASPGVIRSDSAARYSRDTFFAFNPQVTNRTAQSAINAAYAPTGFWDGRATGRFVDPQTGQVAILTGGALESQAVGPVLSSVEMAHADRNWDHVCDKLRDVVPVALTTNLPADVASALQISPDYPALFEDAFGSREITARRIAFAIATYERTLIADQTDWDRFQAGVPNAMTPQEMQGWQAIQASNCTVCHAPPLFSDNTFRNIGLRPPGDDPGRQGVTGQPGDQGRFKVPSLRNTALRSSFMHTGQFTNLGQVMGFYANRGAQFPQNRDPVMQTVNVPPQAAQVIQAFLTGALVDPRVAAGQAPFDHPTMYARRPNANAVQTGTGTAGSGGIIPSWIAPPPPNVGNADFKLGVQGGRGGATARLFVSSLLPVNNQVAPDQILGPISLNGSGNGAGSGTILWPIPANPALNGSAVFVQWVINDPAAVGGLARTRPLMLTYFCGTTGCPSPCYADCDTSTGKGTLDVFDFLCFQNRYAASSPSACDCDVSTGAGVCDVFDFLCFQNAFAGGCQ